jgi:hypothetical protein
VIVKVEVTVPFAFTLAAVMLLVNVPEVVPIAEITAWPVIENRVPVLGVVGTVAVPFNVNVLVTAAACAPTVSPANNTKSPNFRVISLF